MTTANVTIRANDKTKKAFASVNNKLKGLTGALTGTQAKIAGLVGAAGFGALIAASFQAGDATAKLTDKIGVSAKEFSGLAYAVEQTADVTEKQFGEALTKASKRLGEFAGTGGGAAAKWLERFNFDIGQLQAMSPDQLFRTYAEAIGGLNNRGEQLAAISALMGDESRALINTIDAGPEAMEAMAREAESLGIAMDRADLAKIEAANDSFSRLAAVARGLGNRIAVQLAPYAEALANYFADAAVESDGFGDTVINVMEAGVKGVAEFADAWTMVERGIVGIKLLTVELVRLFLEKLNTMQQAAADFADWIPGVEVAEPVNALSKATADARARSAELRQELIDLANAPSKSESVAAFFEDIRKKADEAANNVAESKKQMFGGRGGGSTGGETAGSETEAATLPGASDNDIAERLQKLQDGFRSEQEILQQQYVEKEFIVEEAFQEGLIREQERKQLLRNLEEDHQSALTEIEREGYTSREEFAQLSTKNQAKGVLGELTNLTAGVAQHNRSMFEINKAAGIAQAIISAHESAARTMEAYPYPVNVGLAALSYAAGLARVQAIRATSFSGGGGGTTPSSAGGSSTVNSQPVDEPPQIATDDNQREEQSRVQVIIQGNVMGNEEFESQIVETIRDAQERDRI